MQKGHNLPFSGNTLSCISQLFLFSKHLRTEILDFCIFHFPGIRRQSRFAAGLLEESDSVPAVLRWNLRQ